MVGRPDELKGTAIVCFVTLRSGRQAGPELMKALTLHVGQEIGPIVVQIVERPSQKSLDDLEDKVRSLSALRR